MSEIHVCSTRKVTLWSYRDTTGAWRYNHLQSGHAHTRIPQPMNAAQETAWTGRDWKREHGVMNADNVVKVTA